MPFFVSSLLSLLIGDKRLKYELIKCRCVDDIKYAIYAPEVIIKFRFLVIKSSKNKKNPDLMFQPLISERKSKYSLYLEDFT